MVTVPAAQIPGVYHRRIGDIVVTAVSDGYLDGTVEVMQNIAPSDAERMLATIAGKTHIVYTGVTLERADREYRDTRVAESEVRMLPLSQREIEWYVATGEARGKAEQAWGDATSRVRTFQEDAEQYVRENPTKAVFTALGIGFVLGLILRR